MCRAPPPMAPNRWWCSEPGGLSPMPLTARGAHRSSARHGAISGGLVAHALCPDGPGHSLPARRVLTSRPAATREAVWAQPGGRARMARPGARARPQRRLSGPPEPGSVGSLQEREEPTVYRCAIADKLGRGPRKPSTKCRCPVLSRSTWMPGRIPNNAATDCRAWVQPCGRLHRCSGGRVGGAVSHLGGPARQGSDEAEAGAPR